MIDASPAVHEATTPTRRLGGPLQLVLLGVGVLVLLATVRALTGADDLTSRGTFAATLRLAVPIGLAGLGALYSERAGVVNIGLEGMMILGTWFGAWGGVEYGPWWGVLLGILGGAVGGLIHAVATVSFGIDHVVSGVAINILGAGAARFLSVIAYADAGGGGGATQSPPVQGGLGSVNLPFLAGGTIFGWRSPDVLGRLEALDVFFVSDVAALARAVTGDLSWLTVAAVALVPATFFVLWRTPFGLRLRSVGEYPGAAESLGVNVYRVRYAGVVISGALAGLAGAFLVLVASGIYREGQTNGRGFIGLAALIFGNWRPGGVALGAGLFGFADALQLRQDDAVHALLLFVAIVAGLAAVGAAIRRRARRTGVLAVVAGVFAWWFATTETVPSQFVFFTPHLATLLVLAFAAQRLRPPAAVGAPYRKGQV